MRRSPLQNLILSKPLSFLLLPANTRRGNSERFDSKSQGHPLTSLCRPICASAQGPGQSQRCRRGRSSQHPAFSLLRAQRLPARHWPSRGRQLNPKQVWLKLCPPLHPRSLLAPKFCTTPLPLHSSAAYPKKPPASTTSITHILFKK